MIHEWNPRTRPICPSKTSSTMQFKRVHQPRSAGPLPHRRTSVGREAHTPARLSPYMHIPGPKETPKHNQPASRSLAAHRSLHSRSYAALPSPVPLKAANRTWFRFPSTRSVFLRSMSLSSSQFAMRLTSPWRPTTIGPRWSRTTALPSTWRVVVVLVLSGAGSAGSGGGGGGGAALVAGAGEEGEAGRRRGLAGSLAARSSALVLLLCRAAADDGCGGLASVGVA